jgi:hypothetical protein
MTSLTIILVLNPISDIAQPSNKFYQVWLSLVKIVIAHLRVANSNNENTSLRLSWKFY